MLLLIVQIMTLISLAVFLLVNEPTFKEVGRVVAGVGAAVWALLLMFGL